MQLQSFFNTSLSAFELSGVGFFVAIAILACLLGVELACTFILINKMLQPLAWAEPRTLFLRRKVQDLYRDRACLFLF